MTACRFAAAVGVVGRRRAAAIGAAALRRFTFLVAALMAMLLVPAGAWAQHEHMDIFSTEPGGGSLVLDWDFGKRVKTFQVFCAADLCLYSTINPAFMAPDQDDEARNLYRIADGTTVRVEITMGNPAVTLNVDGARLRQPPDSARLGTMPPIHNHPSWQLVVPESEVNEYSISYVLKDEAGVYGDSPEYTSIVSNLPQVLPTPCPAYPCPADCDEDGAPSQGEIAGGVEAALDGGTVGGCVGMDVNGDGVLTADEIVAAVVGEVQGCPVQLPATLPEIQRTLFSPSCAIATCHNAASANGNLVLEADVARAQLVGVKPDVSAAADAGLLRVVAGDADHSFLYQKLVGPRPEWGSLMPLNGACLLPEQLDQVRRWIEQGAQP